MNMEWISVKDRLPEIPEGQFGISVLVAEFDKIYEECNPGHGYAVNSALYCKVFDTDRKEWGWSADVEFDFMELYVSSNGSEWGPTGDEVTHWMYLPEPPKYITKSEEVVDNDICPECGYTWDEHEFAVPAPYCPTSFVPPKPSKVKK